MKFTLDHIKIGKTFKRQDGRVYYLSTRPARYSRASNNVHLRSISSDECWASGIARILDLLNTPAFGFTLAG